MGFGVAFRTDFGQATFNLFSFGFHLHAEGDTDPCMFRFGFMFALFGLHLDIGMFDDSLFDEAYKKYGESYPGITF